MALLNTALGTDDLEDAINRLQSLLAEANMAETSEEAIRVGGLLAKLGEEITSIGDNYECDGLDAEASDEEEWDDYYGVDDDFPMYLEYDDWKEDNHPANDIDW